MLGSTLCHSGALAWNLACSASLHPRLNNAPSNARTIQLGDRGYDADWFRAALAERGIAARTPSKSNRKVPIPHGTVLYRQRHRIENMFGKLNDWRRIHTRYDRCAHTFMSAICIAATVIFWLNQ
jgi:transposase